MKLSTVFAILSAVTPVVIAECCHKKDDTNCYDGTAGTPCCAYGRCNIFCCNCDGGCRHSKAMGKFELAGETEVTATDAFHAANTDNSGNLTLDQYVKYMGVSADDQKWVDWFNKHANADGIVTINDVSTA